MRAGARARGIGLALAVAVVVAATPATARAAEAETAPAARASVSPGEPRCESGLTWWEAGARASWIAARMKRTARTARIWSWSWGGGIAVAGVANLVAVPFVAPGDRVDWYTGAVSAAVGVIPFVFLPLDVIADSRDLQRRLDYGVEIGSWCWFAAHAEELLARDAANQALGRKWWAHAGNVAFNTGVMLFLGLGYHHWTSGILNGAIGVAVGEAIIFTQPTSSIADLAEYRSGHADFGPPPPQQLGLGYAHRF